MSYNCSRVQGTSTCYGQMTANGGCDPCDSNSGNGLIASGGGQVRGGSSAQYKCSSTSTIYNGYDKCTSACNTECIRVNSGRSGGNPIRPNPTNPADPRSMGFSTSYDGRIRGGIKTPDYIRSKELGKEFNIMDSRASQSKPMLSNRPNGNAPNSPSRPSNMEGKIVRIHPLDIAQAPRRIGAIVYDPISAKWKEDDGRPRGIIYSGGKKAWGCWGKCVVKRWHGIGNKVKCPCNKGAGGNSCECSGCMSGGAC